MSRYIPISLTMLITTLIVTSPAAVIGTNSQGLHAMDSLVIDGGGDAVILRDTYITQPLVIRNSPGTVIENSVFDDGATIFIERSDYSLVRNNTVKNGLSYSIFLYYSNHIRIYNNSVINGDKDGIIAYSGTNMSVRDNVVINSVKNGIFAKGNDLTISGNKVSEIQGTGIYLIESTSCRVAQNEISNVDWTPLAVDSTTFDSCTFENNTYNGNLLTSQDIDPDHTASTTQSDDLDSQTSDSQSTGTSGTTSKAPGSNDSQKSAAFSLFIPSLLATLLLPLVRKQYLTNR